MGSQVSSGLALPEFTFVSAGRQRQLRTGLNACYCTCTLCLAALQAHQVKLERRAEGLALQLAQYTSLLSAAEGVGQLPRLGGGSPGSAGRRAGGGGGMGGSPVQAAITALQARKAAEEAAALREQLRVAQADVASVRRSGMARQLYALVAHGSMRRIAVQCREAQRPPSPQIASLPPLLHLQLPD